MELKYKRGSVVKSALLYYENLIDICMVVVIKTISSKTALCILKFFY